jgi:hypothetical protein
MTIPLRNRNTAAGTGKKHLSEANVAVGID